MHQKVGFFIYRSSNFIFLACLIFAHFSLITSCVCRLINLPASLARAIWEAYSFTIRNVRFAKLVVSCDRPQRLTGMLSIYMCILTLKSLYSSPACLQSPLPINKSPSSISTVSISSGPTSTRILVSLCKATIIKNDRRLPRKINFSVNSEQAK